MGQNYKEYISNHPIFQEYKACMRGVADNISHVPEFTKFCEILEAAGGNRYNTLVDVANLASSLYKLSQYQELFNSIAEKDVGDTEICIRLITPLYFIALESNALEALSSQKKSISNDFMKIMFTHCPGITLTDNGDMSKLAGHCTSD